MRYCATLLLEKASETTKKIQEKTKEVGELAQAIEDAAKVRSVGWVATAQKSLTPAAKLSDMAGKSPTLPGRIPPRLRRPRSPESSVTCQEMPRSGTSNMLDPEAIVVKGGILVLALLTVVRFIVYDYNKLMSDFRRNRENR